MPFIQINLGAGRTPEQKDQLIRAVSAAAAEAISVPEASVRVWVVEVPATEVLVGGVTLAERQAAKPAGPA
ncbi:MULTISPECIES: tautomerase family protein [unclassified Amycolatopsis]|uniref:tautomerase family protein n=1 Tax=unclassified Amycolatopsis TaxID=2618356 RepID=UPI001C6A0FDA|nr:tautomerase family protein [Amycolatopsis sp. DSM 110486]QYN19343.1 tautomerase family protein [Amycolatopsis sp. DSM 110486]